MGLGVQNSKLIYTVEPSLNNRSEYWLELALWHGPASGQPTDSFLKQQQPSVLSENKALRGLKRAQPGVYLSELASRVPAFLVTALSPQQPPHFCLHLSLSPQQSGTYLPWSPWPPCLTTAWFVSLARLGDFSSWGRPCLSQAGSFLLISASLSSEAWTLVSWRKIMEPEIMGKKHWLQVK